MTSGGGSQATGPTASDATASEGSQLEAAAAGSRPLAAEGTEEGQSGSGTKASSKGAAAEGGKGDKPKLPRPEGIEKCPRCDSDDTKFCYYNNYNIKQPRYYCRSCQRYWTNGGTLRDVPVGSGRRKTKAAGSSTPTRAKSGASHSAAGGGKRGGGGSSAAAAAAAAPPLPLPPVPVGAPAMPFMEPLSSYGLTNLATVSLPSAAAAPLFDPAAAAVAVAAGQLTKPLAISGPLSRATAGSLLTDPLPSAFHSVGASLAAAAPGAGGAPAPADGADLPQKRARTDGSGLPGGTTAAAIAALAAVTQQADKQVGSAEASSGLPPLPASSQPGRSDGMGLGMAGPLSSDWLSMPSSMPGNPVSAYSAGMWGLGPMGAGWPSVGQLPPPQQQQQQRQQQAQPPQQSIGNPAEPSAAAAEAAGMLAAAAARTILPPFGDLGGRGAVGGWGGWGGAAIGGWGSGGGWGSTPGNSSGGGGGGPGAAAAAGLMGGPLLGLPHLGGLSASTLSGLGSLAGLGSLGGPPAASAIPAANGAAGGPAPKA